MGRGFRSPTRVMLAAQIAVWAIAVQAPAAHAQLVPSVSAASAPKENSMERAQRQADNVMRWIKVHADKPRAAPAAAPTPAPAPAPAAPKPVAPKPVVPNVAPARAPVEPEPQKTEVAAPPAIEVPVAAPAPAPAPVAPVVAPPPPPPAEEEEEDDTPLKAISQEQPNIPRNLLNTLTSGKVMVRFTIEPSGKTRNVEIVSSSNRRLNQPTISAVNTWLFQPIKTARLAQLEFDFLPQ